MPLFRNRSEAGKELAKLTRKKVTDQHALILPLPRGGVPVAAEIARAMDAELDVFLVRKLGLPGREELAIGAIATGGVRVLNDDLIRHLRVSEASLDEITTRETVELVRRERIYRHGRQPIPVRGRTVVLVDDGLATGASMLAAVRAVRLQHPKAIFVAVPVASRQSYHDLLGEVDQVICVATPEPFGAVGIWYEDFAQTSDEEVYRILDEATHAAHAHRVFGASA